ncbi:MAG: hypothetical protein WKF87_00260 [Chryseolinea sp.]
MSSILRQYAFAFIFIAVGVFQLVKHDLPEASLYLLAGAAFIFNALAGEPRLVKYKKMLAIITWVLIAIVGVLFLYLLQFKYL